MDCVRCINELFDIVNESESEERNALVQCESGINHIHVLIYFYYYSSEFPEY